MTEAELLELLLSLAPETLEGWAAWAAAICAFLSVVLPRPGDAAHPLWKALHKGISIIGLGSSRLRGAIMLRQRKGKR